MANFFSASYWKARFFKALSGPAAEANPGAMSANLTGSGAVTGADLVTGENRRTIDLYFGPARKTKKRGWIKAFTRSKDDDDEIPPISKRHSAKRAKASTIPEPASAPIHVSTIDSPASISETADDDDDEDIILAILLAA